MSRLLANLKAGELDINNRSGRPKSRDAPDANFRCRTRARYQGMDQRDRARSTTGPCGRNSRHDRPARALRVVFATVRSPERTVRPACAVRRGPKDACGAQSDLARAKLARADSPPGCFTLKIPPGRVEQQRSGAAVDGGRSGIRIN